MCAASAPSADDLAKKLASTKKVETKVSGGLDPVALEAMKKVFDDNGGDLGKVATQLGVSFKKDVVPKDATDFGVRMLTGTILLE